MSEVVEKERREPWWGFVIVAIVIAALTVTIGAYTASVRVVGPSTVVYVTPHPDDEFQYWSILERDDETYPVVVLLSRGEQTGYCDPEFLGAGWQSELEPAPEPVPSARFTEECEGARITSFLRYFADMSQHDDRIPGRFSEPRTVEVADPDAVTCRIDELEPVGDCQVANSVDVYDDLDGRGVLVVFNLGDSDLTAEEVQWAVQATLHDDALGVMPPDRPVLGLVGSYSTPESGFPYCFDYPHPDHLVVDQVLWDVDFGAGFQASATCLTDPRRSLAISVSSAATDAAFSVDDDGTRTGAHTANYGWLNAAYYPVARFGQSELFHRDQQFWVRYW